MMNSQVKNITRLKNLNHSYLILIMLGINILPMKIMVLELKKI